MSAGRGLPLLSGPPPPVPSNLHEASCRKCDKEFNLIFSRLRRCNHCGTPHQILSSQEVVYDVLATGYAFCHSCTDYQALMPRTGNDAGYDSLPVCAFCIENLNSTYLNHLSSSPGHVARCTVQHLPKDSRLGVCHSHPGFMSIMSLHSWI